MQIEFFSSCSLDVLVFQLRTCQKPVLLVVLLVTGIVFKNEMVSLMSFEKYKL